MKILEVYLPKMMDEKEIKKIAKVVMAKPDVANRAKIGIFVGSVMKECKGLADGAVVKKIVEELLA